MLANPDLGYRHAEPCVLPVGFNDRIGRHGRQDSRVSHNRDLDSAERLRSPHRDSLVFGRMNVSRSRTCPTWVVRRN